MTYYPKFAELLEQHLFEAERSASWLAGRLQVNASTVARWRNGVARPQSPERVQLIADLLGVRQEEQIRSLMEAVGYAYSGGSQVQASLQPPQSETVEPGLQMTTHLSLNVSLTDAVLVATLGSAHQVIGLATQLLLHKNEPISKVIVLHTRPTRTPIDAALPALERAFVSQPSWPELETVEMPIDDTISPSQIEVFAQYLFQQLKRNVGYGTRVHLLLAGGRKSMAMIGTTIAQMLLGPDDRLWYIYSDNALRLSRRTNLRDDDYAELIAVPLPRMNAAQPIYTRSFLAESPQDAFQALEDENQRRLRHFVEQELTAAERELAMIVVQDVLTVAEIAEKLHKEPKTITNQLSTIYSKAESTFGLRPGKGVKREFLRRQLLPYFEGVV